MSNPITTVQVLSINQSRKAAALADLSIQISTELGDIAINDARVLRNRSGELWVAMPAFSIQDGKNFRYETAVTFSPKLKTLVNSAILEAFENWQKELSSAPAAMPSEIISGGR